MAFESVRSYVQLASGLGEMTKARALEAAQGLLALPGADEVTRRAVQASTLADQLLEAAKANRDNLVALIQSEVEAALRRADVARLADVEAARTSLAALTHELADLRATVLAAGVSAVSSASRSPLGSRGRSATGAVSTRAGHVGEQAADRFGLAEVTEAAAPGSTAKKATAKKATAERATAKKATAKRATATTAAAKKSTTTPSAASSAAGQPAAKKSAAKKSTTKKSAAKKSAAKRSTAKKSTAKKSTAKKATT